MNKKLIRLYIKNEIDTDCFLIDEDIIEEAFINNDILHIMNLYGAYLCNTAGHLHFKKSLTPDQLNEFLQYMKLNIKQNYAIFYQKRVGSNLIKL